MDKGACQAEKGIHRLEEPANCTTIHYAAPWMIQATCSEIWESLVSPITD